MLDLVFATATVTVRSGRGLPVQVVWGSHWPANDPIVQRYPHLFTTDPTPGLCVTREPVDPPAEMPVEQATAAPGEKRTTARRPKGTTGD